MITPAQRAELRRLYYGKHWKMGTIAAQLGLHRETVRAAVEHETGGVHRGGKRRRPRRDNPTDSRDPTPVDEAGR